MGVTNGVPCPNNCGNLKTPGAKECRACRNDRLRASARTTRQAHALALRASKMSYRKIGAELGITVAGARDLIRRAEKRSP